MALEFISDRIRLAHLKSPDTQANTDDLRPAKTDELLADNDFVFVRETPNYLVYTERWLPVCRTALRKKYGDSSNATILGKMPPRFIAVGKEVGLEMMSHDLVSGKSVVVYAKPSHSKPTRKRTHVARKHHRTDAPKSLKGLR